MTVTPTATAIMMTSLIHPWSQHYDLQQTKRLFPILQESWSKNTKEDNLLPDWANVSVLELQEQQDTLYESVLNLGAGNPNNLCIFFYIMIWTALFLCFVLFSCCTLSCLRYWRHLKKAFSQLKKKEKEGRGGNPLQLWNEQLCAMYCPGREGREVLCICCFWPNTCRWGLDFYQLALQTKLSCR